MPNSPHRSKTFAIFIDQGWLVANLGKRRGGLGFGLYGDDPLGFFLIDEHLAYGNPSTAHCFQVHNNALMMIDAMASDAQVANGSSRRSSAAH